MKLRKYIASALVLRICKTSVTNTSFASGKGKDKYNNNKSVIQQQLDAFDTLEKEIQKNRNIVVQPDKDSNGKARAGTYPTRKGVILVTRDGSFDKIVGHAGIVYNSTTTIEAFPKEKAPKNTAGEVVNGVTTYANKWNTRYKKVYAVTTSGTTIEQDSSAADYAYTHRNKPYNWVFTSIETTDKFYCSQLVYKSYKTKTGKNLNQGGGIVFPIDLVQSSNTYTIYTQGV